MDENHPGGKNLLLHVSSHHHTSRRLSSVTRRGSVARQGSVALRGSVARRAAASAGVATLPDGTRPPPKRGACSSTSLGCPNPRPGVLEYAGGGASVRGSGEE